jgi:hypothetical protein
MHILKKAAILLSTSFGVGKGIYPCDQQPSSKVSLHVSFVFQRLLPSLHDRKCTQCGPCTALERVRASTTGPECVVNAHIEA